MSAGSRQGHGVMLTSKATGQVKDHMLAVL